MAKKINKYLSALFVLFILIRLPYLDQLNLLHDERDIVLSGYSIARTARDLYSNFMPLSFNNISPDNPLFAIYFSALSWLIFPIKSIFFARLPFVLISAFLIFIVYELINTITKDKKVSLITTVIFCFSPWIFHITRLSMDISVAIVFLLLGVLLYLKNKKILSYLFFFLTFFTYQGFRILIPFLVFYLEFFFLLKGTDKKKFIYQNIINVFFIVFLFASVFFIDAKVTQNRFQQVAFLNTKKFTQDVNTERHTSIAPEKIKVIFSNKITATLNYILVNFTKGQDLTYLFKEGDYSPINGNASAGQFFFPLIFFYYLGFMYLGKKFTRENLYIAGFIFLGMLPALASINSATYSIRSILSAIGFSYIITLGILMGWELLNRIKNNKFKLSVIMILLFVASISLVYFSYNYYFRRPRTVSELFNENERQLANYLFKNKDKKYIVYYIFPREIFFSIVFSDKNTSDFNRFQNSLGKNSKDYQWNNVIFKECETVQEKYFVMKNSIISETCLNKEAYEYLNLPIVKTSKIFYQNASDRVAYFIFN